MKKTTGTIVTLIGLIGVVLFGIQAAQASESFSLLGLDITVSQANWGPVIISGLVMVVGVVLLMFQPKNA